MDAEDGGEARRRRFESGGTLNDEEWNGRK